MKAKLCVLMVTVLLLGVGKPNVAAGKKPGDSPTRQVYNECDISVGPGSGTDTALFTPPDPPNVAELRYRKKLDCPNSQHGVLLKIVTPVTVTLQIDAFTLTLDPLTQYTLALCGDPYTGGNGVIHGDLSGGNVMASFDDVGWFGSYMQSDRARVTLDWETNDKVWVFVESAGITVPLQLKGPSLAGNTFSVARVDAQNNVVADALFELHPDHTNANRLNIWLHVNKDLYFGHSMPDDDHNQRVSLMRDLNDPQNLAHYTLVLSDFATRPTMTMLDPSNNEMFKYVRLKSSAGSSGDDPVVSLLPHRGTAPATGMGYYMLVIDWKGRVVAFGLTM